LTIGHNCTYIPREARTSQRHIACCEVAMGSAATAVGLEAGSEVQAGEQEVVVGADLEVLD